MLPSACEKNSPQWPAEQAQAGRIFRASRWYLTAWWLLHTSGKGTPHPEARLAE